jgi:large subunit ribosomal protein L21
MKFAVLGTGGKQYIVSEGQTLKIEKLIGDYTVGSKLSFDNVLATFEGDSVSVGKPTTGTKVEAEIVSIGRHPKVTVLRYMPKSRWAKKNGHKQPFFEVKVTSVK